MLLPCLEVADDGGRVALLAGAAQQGGGGGAVVVRVRVPDPGRELSLLNCHGLQGQVGVLPLPGQHGGGVLCLAVTAVVFS